MVTGKMKYIIYSTIVHCIVDIRSHVIEEKLFIIKGDNFQLMNWDQYGLRITVAEGTLLSSDSAEVTVSALAGGEFMFPPSTKLVSAVYVLSVSKPLLKPIRLEIQHCINLTRGSQCKKLKFVIAPVHSTPYQFAIVEGGQFTMENRYGKIYRNSFSAVGIVTEESENGSSDSESDGQSENGDQSNNGSNGHQSENGEADQGENESQSESISDSHSKDKEVTLVAPTQQSILCVCTLLKGLTIFLGSRSTKESVNPPSSLVVKDVHNSMNYCCHYIMYYI